jgi:hypothetical protein
LPGEFYYRLPLLVVTNDLGDLYPNERLLWTGLPQRYPIFNSSDVFLVPFSLLWGGFAIFWETSAVLSDEPPFMLLFGGFFVVAGLYFMVGRLIVRHLFLRSSRYQITNRRVIISSNVLGRRRVQSVYLKDLPPPVIANRNGPVGTIKFGNSTLLDDVKAAQANGLAILRDAGSPTLVEVDGARQVRDIIASAQAAITS